MAQVLVPTADLSNDGWLNEGGGGTLYSSINSGSQTALSYAQREAAAGVDAARTFEVRVQTAGTPGAGNAYVRFYCVASYDGISLARDLTVSLYDGATLRDTVTVAVDASDSGVLQSTPGISAALLSNLSDLRIRITAEAHDNPSYARRVRVEDAWIELPDSPTFEHLTLSAGSLVNVVGGGSDISLSSGSLRYQSRTEVDGESLVLVSGSLSV